MTDKSRTREQCEEKHCESRFGSWVYDMYHDWPFTIEDCIGYNGDNTVIEELREMCDDLIGRDLWDRTVIKTEKGYDWDYSSWFKAELLKKNPEHFCSKCGRVKDLWCECKKTTIDELKAWIEGWHSAIERHIGGAGPSHNAILTIDVLETVLDVIENGVPIEEECAGKPTLETLCDTLDEMHEKYEKPLFKEE